MRALILAAGWATRLGPLAAERPKHLLPIGGRAALDFLVDRVDAIEGLGQIDVLTHDAFLPHFEDWARRRQCRARLRIWSNGTRLLEERLGAMGDVGRFLELARPDETLLVLGGDNVCDFDLAPLAEAARSEPVVGLYDVGTFRRVRQLASVEVDADGRVVRLVEKDVRPRTTLAAVAIYGLPRRSLSEVGSYLAEGHAPDNLGYFAEWLVARRRLRGHRLSGRWIDVGDPDEYERACREFGGKGDAG